MILFNNLKMNTSRKKADVLNVQDYAENDPKSHNLLWKQCTGKRS